MLLILLDIHRNILSLQGYVQYISDCISKIQVTLETNSLIFKFYNGSELFHKLLIKMPENFLETCTVLNPDSGTDGKHVIDLSLSEQQLSSNEKVTSIDGTFRLLCDDTAIKNYIPENCTDLNFKDYMLEKLEKYDSFYIYCTNCDSLLTKNIFNFQTVLKYYEDESDSAETWFCHNHDSEPVDNKSDSLYISDLYFYLHDSVLKNLHISEDRGCIKCSKCFSVLSFKKKMNRPFYLGFFADKIMFGKSETESERELQKYKKDLALVAFCNIVQDLSRLINISDIYLQSKVDGKVEVLLLRFSSQTVAQFMLHKENVVDIPDEVEFKAKEVYKVLYCICSPEFEISKKWKHDFRVEFFVISDNMMTVLKDFLLDSSKHILKNQKTAEGFSFGYLPADVHLV